MFLPFVVGTTRLALLSVVGLAMGAGYHKHWSDRAGEPRFGGATDDRVGSEAAENQVADFRPLHPQQQTLIG